MPKRAMTGEESNKAGKCYMHRCPNKAMIEITFFSKKVEVCTRHKYLDGTK
jgi:hypothetical protein